jgi:hypothetical protein
LDETYDQLISDVHCQHARHYAHQNDRGIVSTTDLSSHVTARASRSVHAEERPADFSPPTSK